MSPVALLVTEMMFWSPKCPILLSDFSIGIELSQGKKSAIYWVSHRPYYLVQGTRVLINTHEGKFGE